MEMDRFHTMDTEFVDKIKQQAASQELCSMNWSQAVKNLRGALTTSNMGG
jgi:hypothetical protein